MIKTLALIGFTIFCSPEEQDSIGVETINGKMFVIHKVDEKETLFAISRRYGVSVDAIREANTELTNSIEIGQILKVPYTPKSTAKVEGRIHKVAPKETLFSISKMYNVSMDDLRKWNNLSDNSLSVDQELVIKGATSTKVDAKETPSTQKEVASKGSHIVAEKETMYSISRQYNISVDDLKKWNALESNDLQIGQTLVVADPAKVVASAQKSKTPEPKENAVSKDVASGSSKPSPAVSNSATEVETKASAESTQPAAETTVADTKSTTQKEPVVASNSPSPSQNQTIKISESIANGDEIIEAGVAELIEGTEGNRKYLALHRTAPVGTILKIRNEMNNREVFVRVMGKLPDTALTDKLIIKVSKSAYDRLGAIDPRFRVQVTYYK